MEPEINIDYNLVLEASKDLFKDISFEDENIIINNDRKYAFYIVLYNNTTLISEAIKTVTSSSYSHSSFTFDKNMNRLLTMNSNGFGFENINSKTTEIVVGAKTLTYSVFKVPLNEKELETGLALQRHYIKNGNKLKYDFSKIFDLLFNSLINKFKPNLINDKIDIENIKTNDKFICSNFLIFTLLKIRPDLKIYFKNVNLSNMYPGKIKEYFFVEYLFSGAPKIKTYQEWLHDYESKHGILPDNKLIIKK